MHKQNCLRSLLMEEKILASNLKCPQKKCLKMLVSLVDGILFTVFWNILMVEIKEKTKSMNKIKDA